MFIDGWRPYLVFFVPAVWQARSLKALGASIHVPRPETKINQSLHSPSYLAGSNAAAAMVESTLTEVNLVTVSPSALWFVIVIGNSTPLTLR